MAVLLFFSSLANVVPLLYKLPIVNWGGVNFKCEPFFNRYPIKNFTPLLFRSIFNLQPFSYSLVLLQESCGVVAGTNTTCIEVLPAIEPDSDSFNKDYLVSA